MPSKEFVSKSGGPVMRVSWTNPNYSYTVVEVDGRKIGGLANERALRIGETFAGADGSQYEVRLGRTLQVRRNGESLRGGSGDLHIDRRVGGAGMLFIGFLNFGLGALGSRWANDFSQERVNRNAFLALSLLYVALGLLVLLEVPFAAQASAGLLILGLLVTFAGLLLGEYLAFASIVLRLQLLGHLRNAITRSTRGLPKT